MSRVLLEMYIDPEHADLIELYKKHIEKHNTSNFNNPHPDAGFDLFIPENVCFDSGIKTKMVDLKIKAQMWYIDENYDTITSSSYYLYPRSSISKTPLMLANQVGIIDSGYRNNLMIALRSFDNTPFELEANTRLVQICHPSLTSITVTLLEDETKLTSTTRKGGFGSTGIKDVMMSSSSV
jgi:dUTP pyrophosphatase